MDKERYEAGKAVRTEVLGPLPTANEWSKPFQDLVVEYCWGAIWARPGLDRKTRSMLNLAMLGALGRSQELALHIRGALNNGCSKEEIREVLLQLAIYAGIPAGVEAFRVANAVFSESRP